MDATRTRIIGCVGLATGLAAGTYLLLLRRRCLTWGATHDEVARPIPGDDLLAAPDMVSTRAVTIDAPPSAVWPWLVQMGSGRGGAYTYDWIENLFGLGHAQRRARCCRSSRTSTSATTSHSGKAARSCHVEVLDPEHSLVFRFEDGELDLELQPRT